MKNRPTILNYFQDGASVNHVNATYLKAPELYNYCQALDRFIDDLQSKVIPRIKPDKFKSLYEVNEDDALSIIRAGYGAFFHTPAKWKLWDSTEDLGEDSKTLGARLKHFQFTFYSDKISIDPTSGDDVINFDDVNYDIKLDCYTQAYILGYYVPGLNELIEELEKEKDEEDETTLNDFTDEEMIEHLSGHYAVFECTSKAVDFIESYKDTLPEQQMMDAVMEFTEKYSPQELIELMDSYKK